jgi:glycosyltransferase involved in cell wall biosynthesis
MKVTLVNTIFGTRYDAGAENVVKAIVASLLSLKIACQVISIRPPDMNDKLPLDFALQHVELERTNIYFPFQNTKPPALMRAIWHLLDNFNLSSLHQIQAKRVLHDSDIVFSHSLRGISPSVWSVQNKRKDIVRVHYLHDYQLMCLSSTMYQNGSICRKQCHSCQLMTIGRRLSSASVDIVYGASKYILDVHLQAGYFNGAIARVLQPPLQAELLQKPMDSSTGGARVFGYFGRVSHEKGLHRLLNAFERVTLESQENEPPKLFVAGSGEGEYFDSLVRRMRSLEGVTFLGFQSPSGFFPQIDVLVVPSLWPDPNPLVVVEAYTYSKPVLAASVGGLTTSVRSEQTGLLFDHQDDDLQLIQSLRRLMAGCVQFSATAFNQAVNERNINEFVGRFVGDVDNLLKKRERERALSK